MAETKQRMPRQKPKRFQAKWLGQSPGLQKPRRPDEFETVSPLPKALRDILKGRRTSTRRFLSRAHAVASRPSYLAGSGMVLRGSQSDPQCDPMKEKIMSLRHEANWDGEGAQPITNGVCAAAALFLDSVTNRGLPRPENIAPSTSGAIDFTWRLGNEMLNVQVYSLSDLGFFVRRLGTGGRDTLWCSFYEAGNECLSFFRSR